MDLNSKLDSFLPVWTRTISLQELTYNVLPNYTIFPLDLIGGKKYFITMLQESKLLISHPTCINVADGWHTTAVATSLTHETTTTTFIMASILHVRWSSSPRMKQHTSIRQLEKSY